MIAAIETYNKPDHKYREESFSILIINAWEIFFKAKILFEENNSINSLYQYERRTLKNGEKSKRKYIKRNRSENPMTIGLKKAISIIENERLGYIDKKLKANIEALMEIRDNSIHLINMETRLSKTIQELGTASLINYLELTKQWFNTDLYRYNFYLMPLAFFRDFDSALVLNLSKEERNFTDYINVLQKNCATETEDDKYAFSINLNIRLEKSKVPTAVRLELGKNADAIPVTLSEEELYKNHRWPYSKLSEILKKRYRDFKINSDYHSIRKKLLDDERYVYTRYLDPNNKKSTKKYLYNPNILNEFDKHYKRLK